MTVIRFKNQSDYAFLVWMNSFPNSAHPLDEDRFRTFAKTVARYRNKKWLKFSFFEQRIIKHPNYFDEEKIEIYFERLCDYVEFYKTPYIPSVSFGEGKERFLQVGVKNGEIYDVPISEKEYMSGGVTGPFLG